MPMNTAYLNAIRDHGQAIITHVGLVNGSGVELASAGYARQPVTWTDSANGRSQLGADRVFNLTAGDVVAGWRGYSAVTGGTDYGGAPLTQATFSLDGTYTLLAASTYIDHTAS